MRDDTDTGDDGTSDPLLAVVADPKQGDRHLPYLLGLLDGDDPEDRLRGAFALCLVVEASPDLLGPVVRRLVDRLDDDPPVAVPHALDYLAAREPKAVDEAVTDLAEERELRARQFLYQSGGGFARNESLSAEPGDRGTGPTRLPGGESHGDGPAVYTDEPDEGRPDASGPETPDEGSDEGDESADDTGEGRPDDDSETPSLTRGRLTLVERRLSDVVAESRFDDLNVLSDRQPDRFGDCYRAVGTRDGEDVPLTLSVFQVPEGDGTGFAESFRRAMASWVGVDDHESILTVHDWAVRPRPWATLEHTASSLADRDALPPDEAVATAVEVADAVGSAHQHGVVHGALDPRTVAYSDTTLTDTERGRPRVTAFGLARVYANYQALAAFLDPSYAAPEHYAGRFGRVDHATDVYALGALLYRLVTGEPPYGGRPDEIRAGVLSDREPVPSDVDPDLPAGLDQVVRKAMATQKLTRYETVTHFRRELGGIGTDGT